MAIATQKLSLSEFLNYQDGTDNRYELLDGELKLMAIGTGKHGAIIEFLNDEFRAAIRESQQPWTAKNSAVAVQSPRGRQWNTCRIPDVMVLSIEQWEAMVDRSAVITRDQASPLLVVEVVSESTKSEDYRSKRVEYSVLEISEYWIVDPLAQRVTVCVFEEGDYTDRVFTGEKTIISALFLALQLTVTQALSGKR